MDLHDPQYVPPGDALSPPSRVLESAPLFSVEVVVDLSPHSVSTVMIGPLASTDFRDQDTKDSSTYL